MFRFVKNLTARIRNFLVGDLVIPINFGSKYLIWVVTKEIFSIAKFLLIFCSIKTIKRIACWRSIKSQIKKEKLVIIAGGPSFLKEHFLYLKKHRNQFDLMVLNYFSESDFSETMFPDYYVISDPESLFSVQKRLSAKAKKLRSYLNRFDGFLFHGDSIEACSLDCKQASFIDIESKFLGATCPWFPRAYRSNTTAKAIELGLYLGFPEIYVFGFDYDFSSRLSYTVDNGIGVVDKHHYGDSFECWNDTFLNPAHALSWLAEDLRSFDAISSPRVKLVSDTSYVHTFEKIKFDRFRDRMEDN